MISDIETVPEDDRDDADHDEPSLPPEPGIHPVAIGNDLIDPDAIKVIRRLVRYGHEAYLVGGAARDLLLGRKPKDFDVATSARPQEVRRLFRNCRVIGRRFRLAHILFSGGKIIEVATFRRDPNQQFEVIGGDEDEPERLVPTHDHEADDDQDLLIRYDNVFGEPHEDAIRRDFTINGLFYDIERSEVIDYVGGMYDLQNRIVRTIGPPDVRFREDPVRILRAIKFAARCDLGIEPDLYDAMVDHRAELQRAARPRLLEEVLRLMRGGAAHRSLFLAWETGVLSEVLPEVASYLDDEAPGAELTWGRLAALDRRHRAGRLPSDPVLLGALLLGPVEEWIEGVKDPSAAFEEFVEEISQRLSLPRRMKDRLRCITTAQRRLRTGRLGVLPRRDFFPDAVDLLLVDRDARGEPAPEWVGEIAGDGEPHERGRRRRRRRRRRKPR